MVDVAVRTLQRIERNPEKELDPRVVEHTRKMAIIEERKNQYRLEQTRNNNPKYNGIIYDNQQKQKEAEQRTERQVGIQKMEEVMATQQEKQARPWHMLLKPLTDIAYRMVKKANELLLANRKFGFKLNQEDASRVVTKAGNDFKSGKVDLIKELTKRKKKLNSQSVPFEEKGAIAMEIESGKLPGVGITLSKDRQTQRGKSVMKKMVYDKETRIALVSAIKRNRDHYRRAHQKVNPAVRRALEDRRVY